MSRPPFYLRGGSPKQRTVQSQQSQRAPSAAHSSAPVQRRVEIINVPREEYMKLFSFLREKYGSSIQRKWNSFYDSTFAKVAFLKSTEVVVLFLTDATSKHVNLFEMKISDIELAPKIEVSREYYGYLRRHIATNAGAETYRRGNNFYAEDGTLVAELVSPEKVRIHTQAREGLFSKTKTTDVNIADLKPERIHIPRELLFITKKLFGSYRRFDRGVRMDSSTGNQKDSASSLMASLGLPEYAKIFFGKATAGLTEDEVKYLILNWASDIKNNRRARTTNKSRRNVQPKTIYFPLPQRSAPTAPLIESAEISIDNELLTVEERLEVMNRLGLKEEQEQHQDYIHRATPRIQANQQGFYSAQPSSRPPKSFTRHELRKPQEVEKALRIEAAQNAPTAS